MPKDSPLCANPRHRPQHALSQAQTPWPVTPGANALIWGDPVFPGSASRLLSKRADLRPLQDARKRYSFLAECMTGAGRQPVYRAWPRDVNSRQIRTSVCQLDSGTMLALPRKRGNEWAHVQNAADEVDARVSAPPGHPYWPGTVGDRDVLRAGRQHRCDPA